jgi:hypothetical protein
MSDFIAFLNEFEFSKMRVEVIIEKLKKLFFE